MGADSKRLDDGMEGNGICQEAGSAIFVFATFMLVCLRPFCELLLFSLGVYE